MQIRVVKLGSAQLKFSTLWVQAYHKRLPKNWNVSLDLYKSEKGFINFLSKSKNRSYICALDQNGESYSSESLSQKIVDLRSNLPVDMIVFIVGDSYGLSQDLKDQCDEFISFSSLTMPGEIAFLLLCEQIYRSYTISVGHPYHHD